VRRDKAYFSGESDEKDREIAVSEQRDRSCYQCWINVFTVLAVNTQQLENVGREPRQRMPQLILGLHVAILRFCTGVDWHH